MIGVIARKEFLELRRDGRFRAAAVVLLLLLLVSETFGWQNYLKLNSQAHRASQDERQRWLDQGDKFPHAAAHYGVFAFKAPRPTAILDTGIQPYVGASVWLEAHKQNEMLYRPAEDATALQRFGDLTVASVGQTLLPLLIIFVGFSALAGEREQGTLKQLMILGLRPSQLVFGKALGLLAGLLLVLLPAFVVALASAWLLAPPGQEADELIRVVLFATVYGVYLGGFLFFTLTVSAACRSAKSALVLLLAFWALTTLAVPRALLDVARARYPSTTALGLKHALDESLDRAVKTATEQRKQDLLKQYRVNKVEDLPVDFQGFVLQADEEAKYALFERHFGDFFGTLAEQQRFYQWGAVIAPVTALQLASMALAGTDLGQHRDFIDQAEANRRVIHTLINDYTVRHAVKGEEGDWQVVGGRALWEGIPAFEYRPPDWAAALMPYRIGLVMLLSWLGGTAAAALFAASRLRAE